MAKHGAQGSTFVLLSGEMQIATDSGTQVVNRPGFGIDVSIDGMLGVVRPVPLSEIVRYCTSSRAGRRPVERKWRTV